MKTFLFVFAVLLVPCFSAWAGDEASDQDELRPAEELMALYGLDSSAVPDDLSAQEHHGPPPHYPPYYPPQQPHPHPVPPPQPVAFECGSEDVYGRSYWNHGYDPRWVQQDVHSYCVYQSSGPCRDLGCRRY
ncbi:hypothetical protein WDW37_18265 [Bdellovibrionota bacterium FG-1]